MVARAAQVGLAFRDAPQVRVYPYAFDVSNAAGLVASFSLEPRSYGLVVTDIGVADGWRRSGIGTLIYEFAAELACRLETPLVSDAYRSHFAEAFWRKQLAKGRASVYEAFPDDEPGEVFFGPLLEVAREHYSALYEEHVKSGLPHREARQAALATVRAWVRRLPHADARSRWGAPQYALLNPCDHWSDLSGMP